MVDEDLFPEIHVVCHNCAEALDIPAGLDPAEAVWMHQSECPLADDSEAA